MEDLHSPKLCLFVFISALLTATMYYSTRVCLFGERRIRKKAQMPFPFTARKIRVY